MLRTSFGLGLGRGWAALALAAASLVRTSDARACGGCFHEPPPPTQTVPSVVTDHRMVFSVSPTQTVLWDQIEYSGSPGGFAWVLPVKPGAQLQLSHDEWLSSLDAATQVTVQAPISSCQSASPSSQSSGFGCGSESAGAGATFTEGVDAGAGGADAGVTVVSQEVVGPYDVVTVRASQGDALGPWLRANGYDVPTTLQPVIDAYTTEGFDFIALKLAPNEGVQAMQPVRVVTPGADLTMPLRMVAAGVGANVGVELFVLSEGRYEPQNFPVGVVDPNRLLWDPAAETSNYTTLAAEVLAGAGGRTWLMESAGPVALSSYGGSGAPLDALYTSSCVPTTFLPPGCGGTDAGGPVATDAGAGEASLGDGGAGDAGSEGGATSMPEGGSSAGPDSGAAAPDAGAGNMCGGGITVPCDDLDVAMNGTTPGSLWVTRLRAFLPASALRDDLVLQGSLLQGQVPSSYQTTKYTQANYNPCPGSTPATGCACRDAAGRAEPYTDVVVVFMAGALLVTSLRRRRRNR